MQNSNQLFSNANKYIELLSTYRLTPKIQDSLNKLKEILNQQHNHDIYSHSQGKRNNVAPLGERLCQNGEAMSVRNCNSIPLEIPQKEILSKQLNQSLGELNLNYIEEATNHFDLLRSQLQSYILLNKENIEGQTHWLNHKQRHYSLEETQQFLEDLIQDLKLLIKEQNQSLLTNQNSSNSQCKSNTNCAENSTSVRSLLTQKLKQFASQEFEDHEYKNQIVFHGNLMRQLSRVSKPTLVSRKFEDLSQRFSMQNKHCNEKTKGGRILRKDQRARVQSHKAILRQINLASTHGQQRRAKGSEGGCSRCQIF